MRKIHGSRLCNSHAIYFLFLLVYCSGRDIITPEDRLNDGETLVSAGKTFQLGFFNPNGSSKIGRYVGIWYYLSKPRKIVWVANRDKPLPLSDSPSGVFAIKEDGKLKVLDEDGSVYWCSEISSSSARRVVKLMDSGNLVLRDNITGEILWESFRNPTDTFLPGMKMNGTLTLTSWRSSFDPASGNYTFKQDQHYDNQYITWKNTIVRHWSSKESEGPQDRMPVAVLNLLSNFSEASEPAVSKNLQDSDSIKIPFSRDNITEGLVMSVSGEIQYYLNPNSSPPNWKAPQDRCSVSKACGKFGSCNINNAFMCKCLPGFEPVSPDNWKNGNFLDGCARKSPICEKNSSKDVFLSLKMMQVRKPDSSIPYNSDYCKNLCLSTCQCQAYAETFVDPGGRTASPGPECMIWTDDLTGLQEEYAFKSFNLYVRVAVSDISMPFSIFSL